MNTMYSRDYICELNWSDLKWSEGMSNQVQWSHVMSNEAMSSEVISIKIINNFEDSVTKQTLVSFIP